MSVGAMALFHSYSMPVVTKKNRYVYIYIKLQRKRKSTRSADFVFVFERQEASKSPAGNDVMSQFDSDNVLQRHL